MRVFFLVRCLEIGGAERQLVGLAKGLHKRGHRVAVGVFYPKGPFLAELQKSGIPVYSLDKGGRWDFGRFIVRLASAVRAESPDILHSYLTVPNIYSVLIKPFFPGTRLVWGMRTSNMDLRRYGPTAVCADRVSWALSRFPDLVIANSRSGGEHAVRSGVPAGRLLVVPNGIDTIAFCPDEIAGKRLRVEWGVKPKDRLVGAVGRFDPAKGLPVFLEAASLLAREGPQFKFAVVGNGSSGCLSAMKAYARQLGIENRISWAGMRHDMVPVYSALDVLCSSSIFGEGFPNVIGEAMACGVPCAVTDVGDSAEIIGGLGTVCPPGDPVALKNAITELLRVRLGPSLRLDCMVRIEQLYSVEKMVEATEAAYTKLAAW